MCDVGNTMEIGSHNDTMIKEEQNVHNSKEIVSNSFAEYEDDNKILIGDWQGDTAEVFADYSNHVNEKMRSAIELIDRFRYNVFEFYNYSLRLDVQAILKAKGENNDGM